MSGPKWSSRDAVAVSQKKLVAYIERETSATMSYLRQCGKLIASGVSRF